ncbi:hypothetical protein CCH79_00019530 [Gambusia affinis]|uniref:MTMR6-9 GRAM domain-containing protein n=1 Tax=Gambusia affinis TaxID=33528 RepID=A0A315W3J9_GAMAF|nr:hypothetical protein CCH79_00019530 [Gambusia affinis]
MPSLRPGNNRAANNNRQPVGGEEGLRDDAEDNLLCNTQNAAAAQMSITHRDRVLQREGTWPAAAAGATQPTAFTWTQQEPDSSRFLLKSSEPSRTKWAQLVPVDDGDHRRSPQSVRSEAGADPRTDRRIGTSGPAVSLLIRTKTAHRGAGTMDRIPGQGWSSSGGKYGSALGVNVENVRLLERSSGQRTAAVGTLYLSATHTIFVENNPETRRETWVRPVPVLIRFWSSSPPGAVLFCSARPTGSVWVSQHSWKEIRRMFRAK